MNTFAPEQHQAALVRRRIKFVLEKGPMARLFTAEISVNAFDITMAMTWDRVAPSASERQSRECAARRRRPSNQKFELRQSRHRAHRTNPASTWSVGAAPTGAP